MFKVDRGVKICPIYFNFERNVIIHERKKMLKKHDTDSEDLESDEISVDVDILRVEVQDYTMMSFNYASESEKMVKI